MQEGTRRRVVWLAVLFEGGLALLALGLASLLGQSPWPGWPWEPRAVLWGVSACAPMLVLFAACVRWPVGPLARIKQFSEEIVRPLFGACSLWELALVSALAGVGEEMLFRGVVQGAISRWLNPPAGLTLASILFGLLHPITPTYVVLVALMGVYLGGIWLWTDNLLVVIVAHGLYDFLALVYLTRSSPTA
jgi:membrane protease YdiL (CAAX protease family)